MKGENLWPVLLIHSSQSELKTWLHVLSLCGTGYSGFK
jgi:hypothetical protein